MLYYFYTIMLMFKLLTIRNEQFGNRALRFFYRQAL